MEPLLRTWDSSPISGDPENQIAHFSWCDEDYNFGCSLDEAGVTSGSFAEDGTFSCTDTEGEPVTLKFYRLKVLQQRANQLRPLDHINPSRPLVACFFLPTSPWQSFAIPRFLYWRLSMSAITNHEIAISTLVLPPTGHAP